MIASLISSDIGIVANVLKTILVMYGKVFTQIVMIDA